MRLLILAFALCAFVSLAQSEKKIVCYFGAWTAERTDKSKYEISKTDTNLCTHLIYSFADLGNGVIVPHTPKFDIAQDGYGQVNKLKERNPKLKVMIALGGWKEGENSKYSMTMRTPEGRTKLANSIVEFVKKYRFDGFDLDWEYPVTRNGAPEDKQNLILFLRELYPMLKKDGLELSIAVGANINNNDQQYDIAELAKTVDFINMMTYDMHGAWEQAVGHNSPLYRNPSESEYRGVLNIDSAVKYWLEKGTPSEKLIVGVPFYGRTFTMTTNQASVGSPATQDGGLAGPYSQVRGTLTYLEICEKLNQGGWTQSFDEVQRVPFAYKGNQWVGYDNEKSLEGKASYVQKMNLGGVMIWSIDSDDVNNVCGKGSFPLLKALNSVLRGGVTPSVPTPKPEDSPKMPYPYSTTIAPIAPAQPPTNAPQSNDGACDHEGYIRVKGDCSSFYYCQAQANGSFAALPPTKCAAGLMYNPAINQCDWAQNVTC